MWNEANVALLMELWSYGQSAGQIAKRLRCFSRSAVCAKAQRLGLKRAHKPPTSKPVILTVRKCSTMSAAKRSAPVRHAKKPRAPDRGEYTKDELREMLAQAVKNTG